MKKSLLVLLIFIVLTAVANASGNNDGMEKEIIRNLDQIHQIGELKWSKVLAEEKEKLKKDKKRCDYTLVVCSR
ncbi:MAG: hypothetical protein NDI69_16085 [Bacteriovoracaceae bacterium]|nr:hypothetical protein [Bacteriovoracaceae bacterium]